MTIDYEGGKEFMDPLVRCFDCGELVHRVYIANNASCSHCGSRRFKNLQAIKEEEMTLLKLGTYDFGLRPEEWYPVDPDFFALFEENRQGGK